MWYFTTAFSTVILTKSATSLIIWYYKLATLRLWYHVTKHLHRCLFVRNLIHTIPNRIVSSTTITHLSPCDFNYYALISMLILWVIHTITHTDIYEYHRYHCHILFIELHTILILCCVCNRFVIYKIPSSEPLLCIHLHVYHRYFDFIRVSSDQYPHLSLQTFIR